MVVGVAVLCCLLSSKTYSSHYDGSSITFKCCECGVLTDAWCNQTKRSGMKEIIEELTKRLMIKNQIIKEVLGEDTDPGISTRTASARINNGGLLAAIRRMRDG